MGIFLVALVILAVPASARASRELREKMSALAKDVLKNTKNQPVTVGQFTPTGLQNSNSGPGLERILAAELGALVRDDALFEVKGDYALVSSRSAPGLKEILIIARIIEKASGEERKELQLKSQLEGNNTIAEVIQVTASLPPDGSKEERNKEIVDRLKNPSVFIHGPGNTFISSKEGSPYAVELLVKPLSDPKPQALPRRATVESEGKRKGKAFVDIRQDELYEVKIHNTSDREVAVALTVDGIDMFHFSKDRDDRGRPRFTHFILDPKGSQNNPDGTLTIVGWHNTIDPKAEDSFFSFLVTGYGQGAVSKTGIKSRGGVGVIHVQFSSCRPLPEGASPRSGNETGFGPPRKVEQKVVRYEIDPPHDLVSVRYTR
jgi:hypothetical protein